MTNPAAAILTVELPGTPPGEAALGGAWSRTAVREAVEPWRRGLADALRGERLPARVEVAVTLGFGDRRKRALGNWEAVIRRILVDVLGPRLGDVTVKSSRRKRAGTTIVLHAARELICQEAS